MPRIIHEPPPTIQCAGATCRAVDVPACHCLNCRLRGAHGLCVKCCSARLGYTTDYKAQACQRCGFYLKPHKPPETASQKLVERCACCDWADCCKTCCAAYSHSCCKEPIRFIPLGPAPVFLYPATGTSHDMRLLQHNWARYADDPKWAHIGISDRDFALRVLGRTTTAREVWPKGFLYNPSRRFAAVEIEVFDYQRANKLNSILENWHCAVVHDRSVGDTGFEINTTPACGDVLLTQLADICEGLKQAKAEVGDTCGLHVHVDARDFGYQDIQKLVRVYKEIEPILFLAIHRSRMKNTFCHKCGTTFFNKFIKGIKPKTKELKQALMSAVYPDAVFQNVAKDGNFTENTAKAVRRDSQNHYGGGDYQTRRTPRYYAMNLHSYFLRGTIEFRMHHGTTAYWEIAGWAKMLVSLFDSIHRLSESNILEIVQPTPKEVQQVLEELPVFTWVREETSPDVAAKGLAILKKLVRKQDYLDLAKRVVYHSTSQSNTLPCTYITDKVWEEDFKTLSWEDSN